MDKLVKSKRRALIHTGEIMETLFHPIVVADSKVEVVEAMNGYTQFA